MDIKKPKEFKLKPVPKWTSCITPGVFVQEIDIRELMLGLDSMQCLISSRGTANDIANIDNINELYSFMGLMGFNATK